MARFVLPDFDELLEAGLEPFDEALAEAEFAECCALCGVAPIERGWSEGRVIAWLERNAPETATAAKGSIAREQAQDDRTWDDAGWRSEVQRFRWDSQLAPSFPLPTAMLEGVVRRLDTDTLDCVRSLFVFAVCGRCRAADPPEEAAAGLLERLYVDLRCDGNRSVAQRQPVWPLVERLLAAVRAEARAERREA